MLSRLGSVTVQHSMEKGKLLVRSTQKSKERAFSSVHGVLEGVK